MLRVPSQSLKTLRRTAMYAVLPLFLSASAIAQTTSPPAPVPPTPPPLVTNTGNLSTVGAGGCLQQYIIPIQNLQQEALDDQLASVVAEGIAVAAVGVNLVAQEAAAFTDAATFGVMAGGLVAAAAGDPGLAAAPGLSTAAGAATVLATSSGAKSAALLAAITGFASDEVALAANVATQLHSQDALDLTVYQQTRPNCDQRFTGTVTVQGGGVNVTGASIFNDDVGIDGNLAISGEFSANQVNTSQGISAHGGAIFLGNPDGITYFEGITLGGGALGGAGFGGPTAFTGDVAAVAIGNGASAASVNGTALGTGANASGIGGTALGANSAATTGVAVGLGATTTTGVSIGNGAGQAGDAGVAAGTAARAREASDTAVGNNSTVNAANGAAFGANTNITSLSDNGVAIGENTTIGGVNAIGSDNVTVVGRNIDIVDGVDNAVALGTEANVLADGGIAIGQAADANASDSIAIGRSVNTDGAQAVGIGFGAQAQGNESVAVGNAALALGGNSIAIGNNATAGNGAGGILDATAIGANSSAAFANSAAFGANATATRNNQQVFGTASNTYTMPGITSSASLVNQSGRLEVATTDAAGNLATDGGDIFNALARVQAGVAIAMAIETPELATGEKFGIRIGWGGFDSFESNANAVGASAIGVLGRNYFREGDRLAVDAGVGLGWSEFKDYNQSRVLAGRVGLQFTW